MTSTTNTTLRKNKKNKSHHDNRKKKTKAWKKLKRSVQSSLHKIKSRCSSFIKQRLAASSSAGVKSGALSRIFLLKHRNSHKPNRRRRHEPSPVFLDDLFMYNTTTNSIIEHKKSDALSANAQDCHYDYRYQNHHHQHHRIRTATTPSTRERASGENTGIYVVDDDHESMKKQQHHDEKQMKQQHQHQEDELEDIDLRAELFIAKFREDMRLQRQSSLNEHQEMFARHGF